MPSTRSSKRKPTPLPREMSKKPRIQRPSKEDAASSSRTPSSPPLRKGSSQPTKEGPLTTSQGRCRMSPNRRRCHTPQDSTPTRGAPDPSTYDPPPTPLAADLPPWRWGCCLPEGGTIGGDYRLLRGRTGTGTTTRCPAPQRRAEQEDMDREPGSP
jgi:hypothetical protein